MTSPRAAGSSGELIRVEIVDSFPKLGEHVALEFLRWAADHPGGVISLPTGRTPEHFIKNVQRLLKNLPSGMMRPNMKSLKFVQMDEFCDVHETKSFRHYIEEHYIKGFGLDPRKCLLMEPPVKVGKDLTLRHRSPRNDEEIKEKAALKRWDDYADAYEASIRRMGGIGFFLGGIGPDGHIAFNVRGGSLYSTTRVTAINYETAAAAANDLGGMAQARDGLVMTTGLSTITWNPNCLAIVFAAGDAKAEVVKTAVTSLASPEVPATALHRIANAKFVLTTSAASKLPHRCRLKLAATLETNDDAAAEVVVNVALACGKQLLDLQYDDLLGHDLGAVVASHYGRTEYRSVIEVARHKLIAALDAGLESTQQQKSYVHTAPHHDDVMLGYLPLARALFDTTKRHVFAYATSGFNAVTNSFAAESLKAAASVTTKKGYDDNDDGDVDMILDGHAARDPAMEAAGRGQRARRAAERCHLKDGLSYFEKAHPGVRDPAIYQKFKGMLRELEADVVWGYFGFRPSLSVKHLRLGFYQGKLFTEEPTLNRDVMPIVDLFNNADPDVISVALDPEASGPDTHYKVLQAVAAACKVVYTEKKKPIDIWGYRNVWFRFHPIEASLIYPVGPADHAVLDDCFDVAFATQRDAPFPAPDHEGPFSHWAQKIQADQFQNIVTLLGRDFFRNHPDVRVRAARGLVFLRRMSLEDLWHYARDLGDKME